MRRMQQVLLRSLELHTIITRPNMPFIQNMQFEDVVAGISLRILLGSHASH